MANLKSVILLSFVCLAGVLGDSYETPKDSYEVEKPKDSYAPSTRYEVPDMKSYDTPSKSESYDAPAKSYDAPTKSYGASSKSYDVPAKPYDTPAKSYDTPAKSYEATTKSYGTTNTYSAPATTYAAPATSYATPATSYAAPATSYAVPATSYAAPTTSYAAPTNSYAAPTTSYAAPTTSYVPANPHADSSGPYDATKPHYLTKVIKDGNTYYYITYYAPIYMINKGGPLRDRLRNLTIRNGFTNSAKGGDYPGYQGKIYSCISDTERPRRGLLGRRGAAINPADCNYMPLGPIEDQRR